MTVLYALHLYPIEDLSDMSLPWPRLEPRSHE